MTFDEVNILFGAYQFYNYEMTSQKFLKRIAANETEDKNHKGRSTSENSGFFGKLKKVSSNTSVISVKK